MKLLGVFLFLSTLFSSDCSLAQDSLVDYFVITTDYKTEKKIRNSTVQIYDQDSIIFTDVTGGSGKVEMKLKPGRKYKIIVSSPGKVSRFIYVDVTGLDSINTPVSGGCSFGMFDREANTDYTYIENNPVTIVTYNPLSNSLDFDGNLARKMREEVELIMQK